MKNRIIIAGKGGSGKDYLKSILQERYDMKYCISHTSRPIRSNEIENIDYCFVDKEYFDNNKEEFYEYVEFNGWFYGTTKEEFNKADLLIMTPSGIAKLKSEDRKSSFIVYIDINEDIRKSRMQSRNDADNTERRLYTDSIDFFEFIDYDLIIKNPNFGELEISEVINKYK